MSRKKNSQVQESIVKDEQVLEEERDAKVDQEMANHEDGSGSDTPSVDQEVLFERNHTLRIYERMIVTPHPSAKSVLIQNLGGGTVYVGGDTGFTNLEPLIDGSDKLFTGVSSIYLTSACRPTIRIVHLK